CEDGLLPLRWSRRDEADQDESDPPHEIRTPPPRFRGDPGEERRLFFVGMTRATTQLVLSSAARRPPSPDLAAIDPRAPGLRDGAARPAREVRQLRLL